MVSSTVKLTHRDAPADFTASVAAASIATTVFKRVLGDASRWLRVSTASIPAAMRARRDSASCSVLAEERTQTTR